MNISKKFSILIEKRKMLDHIDYDNEPVILEMVKLFSENINDTIKFLKTECSAEQFVWLSEIFDEIVEATHSKEFIDTLYEVAKKYPKETEEYNIQYFIDTLKEFLEE